MPLSRFDSRFVDAADLDWSEIPEISGAALETGFARPQFLGRGAFADVVAARFHETPVAVKTVRATTAADRAAFLREAKLLSRLRHPHLVTLMGAVTRGPWGGSSVFELCRGGAVRGCLLSRDWTPFVGLTVALQVALNILQTWLCSFSGAKFRM